MTENREYDAVLVLSFGGPERNEDVVPFLRNVTAGRGIPDERLKQVGEHYFHFNGRSPLNDLNLEIIVNLKAELLARGHNLPVYFGNRNWHPLANDTAEKIAADGHRNVLVFATSAWGGYSACRQYDEDIKKMREHLAAQGLPEVTFTKLRQFYDHPTFIEIMAEAVRESFAEVPAERREATRMLFTAHSVPTRADQESGRSGDKNLYSRQVEESSRLIAEAAGVEKYDVVWQSRSGNPATPWLEPDIVDHTEDIAASEGVKSVVVCPVGFISDHIEVIWDLDTELQQAADAIDVSVHRTRTAGPDKRFATMIVDNITEQIEGTPWAGLGEVAVSGSTVNGAPCAPGCCSQRDEVAVGDQREKSATQ